MSNVLTYSTANPISCIFPIMIMITYLLVNKNKNIKYIFYTGCLKIRKFRIQSVVGNYFSSPHMEIKKNQDSPHKDTLV
jgi:hypothetical protein